MKICIVTPSFSGGGAERVAVNLANRYAQKGMDVSIAVFRSIGPYRNAVSERIHIVDMNVSRECSPLKLIPYLRKNKFDIVISVIRDSNVCVGLASFFCPKTHLIFREANTMHAFRLKPNGALSALRKKILKLLIPFTYNRADKIIANSHDTKLDLMDTFNLQHQNLTVISNPVLPENIQKLSEKTPTHPWLGKYRTILSVGRLHQQKNHTMLINAFSLARRSLEDLKLIIIGEGKEKENLVNLVKSKGIQDSVDFLEFQNNPYPYYRNVNLFVHTARWEGFGNVLVEAMACGIPIVATNCPGGPKEILENGRYGDLVEIDDVEGLSEAILKNMLNPDTSRILAAKERALDFSIERIADEYIEFFPPVS